MEGKEKLKDDPQWTKTEKNAKKSFGHDSPKVAATTFLSSADVREGKNRRIALKSLNEITFFKIF